MSTTRTEFGFERTKCGCRKCSINCEHIPGFLVPADVPRIAAKLGYTDLGKFAEENLRASPGWKIGMRDNRTGEVTGAIRLPTLVPARQENGHCKFLKEGRCQIHDVAPYGCAFFDEHMTDPEGDRRSQAALMAVAEDNDAEGDYHLLGHYLRSKGLDAPGPEVTRPRLYLARLLEGLT